ncbi:MAG: hypothetical protein Q7U03_13120 [Syntrophales bacterium]|nr:hypothetical protein [Syntrophales bacterium]
MKTIAVVNNKGEVGKTTSAVDQASGITSGGAEAASLLTPLAMHSRCGSGVTADFFFRFARFEYALKACGYHTLNRNGDVFPDWNRFEQHVEPVFEKPQSDSLRKAIQYYFDCPPKKQTVINRDLQWKDSPIHTGSTAHQMMIYIRRVRNNLFHGGKFKGRYLEEPERSEDLMNHALTMLDACLIYDQDLTQAYNYE